MTPAPGAAGDPTPYFHWAVAPFPATPTPDHPLYKKHPNCRKKHKTLPRRTLGYPNNKFMTQFLPNQKVFSLLRKKQPEQNSGDLDNCIEQLTKTEMMQIVCRSFLSKAQLKMALATQLRGRRHRENRKEIVTD